MLKKLAITLVAVVFVGCYNLDTVGGKRRNKRKRIV
jgi:hypothetical protein